AGGAGLRLVAPGRAGGAGARRGLGRGGGAAARLSHANIVAVHEVGDHSGTPYLVMELVRGGSAQALLGARGRLDWREATRLVAGACRGVAAAPAAGTIHRGPTPANLLRAGGGTGEPAGLGTAP